MLERIVRLLNLSFDIWVVPMDWRGACVCYLAVIDCVCVI